MSLIWYKCPRKRSETARNPPMKTVIKPVFRWHDLDATDTYDS
ncbi:MAG: hypothetical protein ACI8R4_003035, partial [Paracoccaceae bacterium]